MIENLKISFDAVLPLLLVMAAGFATRRAGLMSEETVLQTNNVTFRLFLPILLLNNIRSARVEQAQGLSVLLFSATSLLLLFLLLMRVVPRFVQKGERRGVVTQALFRTNYALFGLAVVANLYPSEPLTIPSLMIPATVPFYNILAVIALEACRGGRADMRATAGRVAKNPLVIACVIGIALLALGNPVPAFLDETLRDLGGVATTLALFTLGASLRPEAVRGNGRALAAVTALKLCVIPACVITLAAALGYRDQALASVMIAFGGPVAVSSFTMARQMGGDSDLAAQLVVTTTMGSVPAMFVMIFILKSLGLL